MAPQRLYLILCYDVVCDKRRNKLFKKLKGFLKPVQKSVFEGSIQPTRLCHLENVIQQTIDLQTDTVRMYRLCGACRINVSLFGTAKPVEQYTSVVVC